MNREASRRAVARLHRGNRVKDFWGMGFCDNTWLSAPFPADIGGGTQEGGSSLQAKRVTDAVSSFAFILAIRPWENLDKEGSKKENWTVVLVD